MTDVVHIAGFHGMDDPFYKERYGAKVWALKGQRYVAGFDHNAEPYLTADVEVDATSALPIANASVHVIGSAPPEGLLLIGREGGVLVSGDCLQNWQAPDAYFSFVGKVMMRLMGFIKPYNVGPAWLKQTKPPIAHLHDILDLAARRRVARARQPGDRLRKS